MVSGDPYQRMVEICSGGVCLPCRRHNLYLSTHKINVPSLPGGESRGPVPITSCHRTCCIQCFWCQGITATYAQRGVCTQFAFLWRLILCLPRGNQRIISRWTLHPAHLAAAAAALKERALDVLVQRGVWPAIQVFYYSWAT